MRPPRALLVLVALALVLVAGAAGAHGVRTASLRVDQIGATRALVRFTSPLPNAASADLPADCARSEREELSGEGQRVYALDCPAGLAGRLVGVHGLGGAVSDATVLVRFADGRTASHLLTAAAPDWPLPDGEDALAVARSYVRAGVMHIAGGADHLLFLALLVLLLRTPRAVLLAETAFTASHSLAFAATSLGWIHVRAAPVEACIALSLVLLALDAARGVRLPMARGALAALVFGLVHGLGFAGGLREAGLPDAHAAVALVGFGAGVEIGQVVFLLVALGLVHALARLGAFARVVSAFATVIGGVATAWLIERLVRSFAA